MRLGIRDLVDPKFLQYSNAVDRYGSTSVAEAVAVAVFNCIDFT
jgi:hypothetical protein